MLVLGRLKYDDMLLHLGYQLILTFFLNNTPYWSVDSNSCSKSRLSRVQKPDLGHRSFLFSHWDDPTTVELRDYFLEKKKIISKLEPSSKLLTPKSSYLIQINMTLRGSFKHMFIQGAALKLISLCIKLRCGNSSKRTKAWLLVDWINLATEQFNGNGGG